MSRLRRRAAEADKLVESTNAMPSTEFWDRYCDSSVLTDATLDISTRFGEQLRVLSAHSDDLKTNQPFLLDACFHLLEASSADDYKASSIKWSPSKKRKEMVLPDMRYLILLDKEASSGGEQPGIVAGFISFMVTYEDSYEVIYIYEIHLQPAVRSRGIGRVLVQTVENIGRKVKVSKCMLTVFASNIKAVKFYNQIGYTIDDFSPGPRIMRNGTIKASSYLILSKGLV